MKNKNMLVHLLVAGSLTAGLSLAQTAIALPQSFTAVIDQIDFSSDGATNVTRYRWTFDGPNQRQRFDRYEVLNSGMPYFLSSYDPKNLPFTLLYSSLIQDFAAGLQFTLDLGPLGGLCYKKKIQGVLTQVELMDSATSNGTARFGTLLTQRLDQSFSLPDPRRMATVYRTANIPVQFDVMYRDGSRLVLLFSNFGSVVNAEDFSIPSYCLL